MGKNFQLACVFSLLIALSGCSSSGSNDDGTGGGSNGGSASIGGKASGTAGKSGGTAVPGKPGEVGGCKMFPAEDAWNLDVSGVAADADWTTKLQTMVGAAKIHPDYGVDGTDLYGIPLNVVPQSQPLSPVVFDDYPDESDAGPYPFPGPGDVMIEGNNPMSCDGDCHLLVVQQGACMLYEG